MTNQFVWQSWSGGLRAQYQSLYHRSYSAFLIFNLSCISMCICKSAFNSNHSIIAFFSWEERWSCIQGLGINSTFFQQLLARAMQKLTGHHQYHRCLRCSWISTFSGSCGHCNLVASWCLDWLGLTFKRRKSKSEHNSQLVWRGWRGWSTFEIGQYQK